MEPDFIPYSATKRILAESVLVLAPHADDEVFGCGGAIRHHIENSVPVCVVVLTDGALYGEATLREEESKAAAQVLGYGTPEFWGLPDRGVRYSEDLVARIERRIRERGVDLVYAPSPWEVHPDHRQTAQLAIEVLSRLGALARIIFYEVGAPLRPNILLDISETASIKDRAMACFASQLEHQDYSKHIRSLNHYRTYTLDKSVTAAEGFLLLSAAELSTIASTGFFDCVSLGVPASATSTRTSPAALAKWPLVSIVVSSMDEVSLKEALDSLAVQTYPNIEVTVVSRQTSHQRLPLGCGRFPLELITSDTSISRSIAGNRGLSSARGAYVVVMSAEDWLMPGHIARLVDLLSANPGLVATHSGVRWINELGQPLNRTLDCPVDSSGLVDGVPLPLCAVMISTSLLNAGVKFDEALMDEGGDVSFWASICKRTVPAHLPGLTAIHRDGAVKKVSFVEPQETQRPSRWLSRVFDSLRR